MNRQARDILNLISSSRSGSSLALQDTSAPHSYYQRLIYSLLLRSINTRVGFESIGRQLVDIARHAFLAQQMDAVEQVSQMMFALPLSGQLRSIAQHYQALCAKQKGDYENARKLLELVLDETTPQYMARTLQAIGLTYHAQGKVDTALSFYVEAGNSAIDCDPLTMALSQSMIAVVRSIYGDHKQALDDLEQLFPLVRAIGKHYPAFYYDFLNSLAVELGEVGRINEARNVCQVTLASPFAAAYPNWLETRDELEAKRTAATSSIVAVSAALGPQAQPSRKVKPTLAGECVFIQRSVAIVVVTVALIETTTSILDRVEHSIIPRGPPARF